MNPDLQQRLVGYLDALEAAAKRTGDFAAAETPELVREWLLWLAIEHFSYAAALLSLSLAALIAIVLAWRAANRLDGWFSDDHPAPTIVVGIGILIMAPCLTLGAKHTLAGTKVLIAPRVVMVEKVAELVKAHKP